MSKSLAGIKVPDLGRIPDTDKGDGRGLFISLALLTVTYAIYNLDKALVSVLLQPIKHEFALSDSALGLLTGAASTLPFLLATVPIGILADRYNRKLLLIALLALWSLFTGLAGFAQGVALLFMSRALVAFFEAGYVPVSMSVISDSCTPGRRSTALGTFAVGAPVGVFLAMAAGGYIAAEHGWRSAFFLAGIPGLVMAALLLVFLKNPRRGQFDDAPREKQEPMSIRTVLSYMVREPAIFHVVCGMVLVIVMLAAYAIWLPTFFARVHGMSLRQAGLMSAIVVGLCGAVGAAVGGMIADRVGKRGMHHRVEVAIAGTLIAGGSAAVALFTASAELALVLFAVSAFFSQFFSGPGYGLVSTLSLPAMRSTTLSVLLLIINIVSVGLGSQLVGGVSDLTRPWLGNHSIAVGIAATLVCSLWGIAHLLIARNHLKKRLPAKVA
jgi:predicted MFS family arabinose efflux permease